jgi:nitroreductase
LESLLKRRSIRKYTDEPVPEELIKEILKAAMSAPSAKNFQPWEFIVINDREILDQVPQFHAYSRMILEAPVAIAVCGNLEKDQNIGWWVQDCAAATENILIAVQSKGLGAVWLGIYPLEERINGLRKLLNLPEHIMPWSLIPIGYPGEEKRPANRFDQSKIHYNGW